MTHSVWSRAPSGRTVRRKKGRGKSEPFVSLPKWMVMSPAWHSLSGHAMAAFVEFGRIYNGANNGSLALSTRTLARIRGCSLDTAARAIRELLEKGFVEIVRASGFNVKSRLAAEYRMTLYRCDVTNASPSKAFMQWRPEIISQYDSMGIKVRSTVRSAKKRPSQYDPSERQAGNAANDAPTSRTHVQSTMAMATNNDEEAA